MLSPHSFFLLWKQIPRVHESELLRSKMLQAVFLHFVIDFPRKLATFMIDVLRKFVVADPDASTSNHSKPSRHLKHQPRLNGVTQHHDETSCPRRCIVVVRLHQTTHSCWLSTFLTVRYPDGDSDWQTRGVNQRTATGRGAVHHTTTTSMRELSTSCSMDFNNQAIAKGHPTREMPPTANVDQRGFHKSHVNSARIKVHCKSVSQTRCLSQ